MENKTLYKIGGLAIFIIALSIFGYYQSNKSEPVACTTEAQICPDGSAVGRTGPKCEFTECPGTVATSTVKNEDKGVLQGSVTIGPVCTEEIKRDYPTFDCTPTAEMYAAAHVLVYKTDKKTLVTTIIPGKDGKFSINLPEGDYFIDMIHQRMGGTKGVPTTVVIKKGKPVTLKLEVDTGLK